ncbi:hypothetical protein JNUCC23_04485 [Peribacillus sp. JNUCC 23]|uniref:hypothetical protein n=1 Tax=Peribacillus sp. NPDC096379 TaxID=3364393 RepID=UPI00382C73AE
MKSFNSVKEIGEDIWDGITKRNKDKFDSVYDFGNWLSMGGLDSGKSFYDGLNDRANHATDSFSDFVNYLTIGGVDLVKGALAPKDALSKGCWLRGNNSWMPSEKVHIVFIKREENPIVNIYKGSIMIL